MRKTVIHCALAVLVLSLAACGGTTTPTPPPPSSPPAPPAPPSPPSPPPPVTAFFVNPITGSDANAGTQTQPLKTIKKAVSLVASGQTVYLENGTYTKSSGDDWLEQDAQGNPQTLNLPDGVALEAVTAGNVVFSSAGGAILNLNGAGSLKNLRLQGGVVVQSSAKTTSISGTNFTQGASVNAKGAASVTLDGASFGAGNNLFATDTAAITVTNSSFDGGCALYAQGSAQVSFQGTNYAGTCLADLRESAKFTMTQGSITQPVPTQSGNEVISASGIAQVTLDAVNASGLRGGLLDLRETSKATVKNSSVQNSSCQGCGASETIAVTGTAKLTLENTTIQGAYGSAVYLSGNATATITGGTISGNGFGGGGHGIAAYQGTQLSVDGTNLSGNKSAGVYAGGAYVTISNAKLDNGVYGLWGGGGSAKLRNCEIKNNKSGIYWDVTGSALDLGKSGDIGNNVIQGNANYALEVPNVANASGTAQAVGNLWAASQQGASAQGKYASALVTGPASGLNYSLPNANTKIQF